MKTRTVIMKSIDTTRKSLPYSPLIPAMEAICMACNGEQMEIILNDAGAFNDLKEYLSERGIGFREIYDEGRMILQFTR